MKKTILSVLLVVLLTAGVGACGSDSKGEKQSTTTTSVKVVPTIAELANSDKDFSQLLQYVDKASLSYLLNSKGSFTIFAPTNKAFEKLDQATLDKLQADNATLLKVLTYHALITKVETSQLTDGQKLTTVEGSSLIVGISGETLTLTSDAGTVATITKANIEASNGMVHKIDTVLVPADLNI